MSRHFFLRLQVAGKKEMQDVLHGILKYARVADFGYDRLGCWAEVFSLLDQTALQTRMEMAELKPSRLVEITRGTGHVVAKQEIGGTNGEVDRSVELAGRSGAGVVQESPDDSSGSRCYRCG